MEKCIYLGYCCGDYFCRREPPVFDETSANYDFCEGCKFKKEVEHGKNRG